MTATFTWIDWAIVAAGLVIVVWIGLRAQRYVRGVADFLSAGRVAGRYVLSVADGTAAMGLISLVAMFESYYQSGFAYGFWGSLAAPVGIVMGLTGYCVYRFRETRAMTLGQFFELRYSRSFRIFAGVLQSVSGIINYGLFPAVGARFIVYYCGLPVEVEFLGGVFPTFALLMAAFLGLAVLIAAKGGQVTIMVTDCVQGLLSYPIYVVVVVYLMLRFSWFRDLAPVITDRPPGESMINPFDISALRDFNVFYVVVGILGGILNRMSWSGTQGYRSAARNAHEQKMGGILGAWRSGFANLMFILLGVVAYAYLNSAAFQDGPKGAAACREELAVTAVRDVVRGDRLAEARRKVIAGLQAGATTPDHPLQVVGATEGAGADAPPAETPAGDGDAASARRAAYEIRFREAREALREVDPALAQTYGTIFGQMRVPMALRYILPIGITGLFCALCVFLMVSTDTTYLHSWGSILIQDIVLPLRGRPFTPRQQLRLLRLAIAGVAVFAFFFSYFFGQVDYILMFFAITGAIWLGGAGICIVGGLYWKRGTTPAAWAALIGGSSLSVLGILIQTNWVAKVYPWLAARGLVERVGRWLERCSTAFEPYVVWRMSADKFPVNSQEMLFLTMLVSVGLYAGISLLTSRGGRVFDMERMLHRGKYHREGLSLEVPRLTWRSAMTRLLGIDNQYTRGDRILAWSVFVWAFGWSFLCSFAGVAIWNVMRPWSTRGWTLWFFFNNFILTAIVGSITTVWFLWGGARDLRRLFRDLAARTADDADDGRVEGHVSADDAALVAQAEHGAVDAAQPTATLPEPPDVEGMSKGESR